jgi:hypothetical protein
MAEVGATAWHAHQRARRPKPFRLHHGPLLNEGALRLRQLWSPEGRSQAVHSRTSRTASRCA